MKSRLTNIDTFLQSTHLLEIITNKNISRINQIGKYLVRSIPHQFVISRVLANCSDPLLVEKLSLSDISNSAPTNRVTLKFVVEDLVNEKFIYKILDPEDTRKYYLFPTDKLLNCWLEIIPNSSQFKSISFKETFLQNNFKFEEKSTIFWNKYNRKDYILNQLQICRYNLLTNPVDIDSWLMLSLCRRTLARDFPPNRDYKHKMLNLALKSAINALKINEDDYRVQTNLAGTYLHKKDYIKCEKHCEIAIRLNQIDFYSLSAIIYYTAASSKYKLTENAYKILLTKFPEKKHLFFTTIGLILLANNSKNERFLLEILNKGNQDIQYLSLFTAFVAGEYNNIKLLDKIKNRLDYIENNFFIRNKVRGMLKSTMTQENASLILRGIDKSDWWSLAENKKVV